jgi:DNA-binding transcriptional regulator GbsR (MarR family)
VNAQPDPEPRTDRDEEAVARFVERLASAVSDAGIPRMPARVFSALLADDDGALTAADLADRLQVSPAAISGAVRYLAQVGMASREREPGSRRDIYRVHDDFWYEAIGNRDQILARWEKAMQEGLDVLGRDTPAGLRLAESLAFLQFVQEEMPGMLARWRARRAQLPR